MAVQFRRCVADRVPSSAPFACESLVHCRLCGLWASSLQFFRNANLNGLIPHFSALIVVPNILNLSCEWAIIPEQFGMDALGTLISENLCFVVLDPSEYAGHDTFGP